MFRALNQVYAVPIQVRGTCAWVRNELKGVAAEGYKQLNLGPPARVLKIEREGGDLLLEGGHPLFQVGAAEQLVGEFLRLLADSL